jgi:MFS family permease
MFAGSFGLLVVARLFGGAMAGNISTASAVVADTTSGRERAGGMGIVGMAIGLGFIFGPVLGGIFGPRELGSPEDWSRGLAWQPFSTCAGVALALALLNLVLAAVRLPETLPPERRGEHEARGLRALRVGRVGSSAVARVSAVYFLLLTAFAAAEFTLTFLASDRLGFTIQDNMWMFVFVGLSIACVQGGLVRRLAPRLGEKTLVLAGLLLLLPAFALIGWARSKGALYLGLFPMAVGSAFALPCLSALVSRYTPAERQGASQGSFRALGSLARAVGPFLGGALYWRLGSGAPYFASALFLLIPLALAAGLPQPVDAPGGAEAA